MRCARAALGLACLLAAACMLATPALADTTANCTHDDYEGNWVYSLGPILPQPTGPSVNCSADFAVVQTLGITLSGLNAAQDGQGNKGNWTMIYNQGAEVWINGNIMFAFASYDASGSFNCKKSMPGWVHAADGTNWRCMQMSKVANAVKPNYGAALSGADKQERIPADVAAINQQLAHARRTDPKRLSRAFSTDHKFLAKINAAQDLFTVKHYPEFDGMSIGQLERKRGSPHAAGSPLLKHVADAKPIRQAKLAAKDVPANFDWRNVSGVNYVSPVRNQGSCGSCYAFSATGMMEARIRVASGNKEQPILSPQDVVSCSNYAQGCDGGFPYLIGGKYSRDFGMAEEACYPYEGVDSSCRPKPRPECSPQRWHAREYYYIGGFYGQSTEQLMQEELMANGPISVSFMVYDDFMNYAGGVYTHQFSRALGLEDGYNPFHLTNHAVLCVGWGVTDDANQTPYWIVKNSWGTGWGESGYFRILRGSSEAGGECAIESLTVSAMPVLH